MDGNLVQKFRKLINNRILRTPGVEFLVKNEMKAYHLNIWTGLQTYKYLRSFDFDIAMFFE